MRSDTPRYTRRSWRPPTDFDRPAIRENIDDLLDGIPQSLWDQPAFDGQTPRQVAAHIRDGGCPTCRQWLDELRSSRPCALCGHYKSSHGYGVSLYPCGAWENDEKCDCVGYEPAPADESEEDRYDA